MGTGDFKIPRWKEAVSLRCCVCVFFCFCHARPAHKKKSQMVVLKLKSRLRRAFLLVDSLHGLKTSDRQLLASLRQNAISHQILLSKVDRIFHPKLKNKHDSDRLLKLCEELRPILQPGNLEGPEALGELIGCSGEKTLENGQKLGVDRVRWAILAAAGLGDNGRKISLLGTADENHHHYYHHADL